MRRRNCRRELPHIVREGCSGWRRLGCEIVIYPVSAFRIAARSIRDFHAALRASGDASSQLSAMMTRAELYDAIGFWDYEALDSSIARTRLPEDECGLARSCARDGNVDNMLNMRN